MRELTDRFRAHGAIDTWAFVLITIIATPMYLRSISEASRESAPIYRYRTVLLAVLIACVVGLWRQSSRAGWVTQIICVTVAVAILFATERSALYRLILGSPLIAGLFLVGLGLLYALGFVLLMRGDSAK